MSDIKGLILAGGLSSRMGSDKAFMKIGKTTQVEYLLGVFSQCNLKAKISCRPEQKALLDQYAECVTDNYDKIGPMGGILSAFEKYQNVSWLVIACDMPIIKEVAVKNLMANRDPLAKLTCYITQGGFPEPLFSIWEPSIYKDMKLAEESGNYSLISLINSVDANMIKAESDEIFININTPEELNKYQ